MGNLMQWLKDKAAQLTDNLVLSYEQMADITKDLTPDQANSIITYTIGARLNEAAKQASVPTLMDNIIAWANEHLAPTLRGPVMDLMKELEKSGVINKNIKSQLSTLISENSMVAVMTIFSIVRSSLESFIKTNSEISSAFKSRELAQSLRPFLPDAASVMNAMFIDPSLAKEVRKILAQNGISEDHINMMFKAQYRTYDEGTIRDLFLRGELTADEMYNRMRELHYTDTRINEIVKTWNILPGAQDVIRYAVKEAFSDSKASALGLDSEYPERLTEYAKKIGMPVEIAKYEWRAHWQLPSPLMGFEMLHRGEITDDELGSLLTALDYSPRWHKALKGISYNLVTRVDARRLYEKGIWNDEKLFAWFKSAGYTETDARDMTSWAKLEYGQQDKETSLGTILDSYQGGIIPRPDAVSLIKSLGYPDDRVEWLLNLSDYKDAADARRQIISGVKKLYIDGHLTSLEVRSRLGQEGIDAQYIEALITNWDAEIVVNEKTPTKSDVDRFYKAHIYTKDQYVKALKKLGYNDADILAYVKLNEPKDEDDGNKNGGSGSGSNSDSPPTLTKSDIDKLYKSGNYTEAQYRSALRQLGYGSADIDAYVRLNTPEEE